MNGSLGVSRASLQSKLVVSICIGRDSTDAKGKKTGGGSAVFLFGSIRLNAVARGWKSTNDISAEVPRNGLRAPIRALIQKIRFPP